MSYIKNYDFQKIDLLSLNINELTLLMNKFGYKSYRAKQLFFSLHKKCITDLEQIKCFPIDLCRTLKKLCMILPLRIMDILISNDGSRKYIFKCFDGNLIETVFIPGFLYSYKNALCISSQVGCCMNCSFCATGKMGFRRNLLPSEILNQIYVVLRDLIKIKSCENVFKNHLFNNSRIINNIVYMGMGEPLHNYNNVTKSIELLMHEKGQLYSYRNITVSTSGIVKNINRLWHTKVNLAISLNAADNLTRDSIMPINKKWNIKKLLNACKQYSLSNRKIVTFVYIMISGLNDSDLDAKKLANLLINFKAKINLIPFNTHKFSIFKKPNYNRIIKFQNILLSKKFSVFIRNTRGADINAACGMLYTV